MLTNADFDYDYEDIMPSARHGIMVIIASLLGYVLAWMIIPVNVPVP
jgi:hypothetical protein